MADRRCPNCGELVPSTSITCPKCYRKIPNEPEPVRRREEQKQGGGRTYNRKVALLLTLVPGLFGMLGLGLIYAFPRRKRGYLALLFGALTFVAAVFFTVALVTIFLAVPFWILYVLMYLGCLALIGLDNMTVRMYR